MFLPYEFNGKRDWGIDKITLRTYNRNYGLNVILSKGIHEMNTIQDFIKEAQGYLFQLDDVSNTLTEAIQDRAAWTQNARLAQDNYDSLEAGFIFDLMTGDGMVATGKNAEQRSAAKEAELAKFRRITHEWHLLQDAKDKQSDSQALVEQLEKRFAAVRIQAELVSSIIKALSGQSV